VQKNRTKTPIWKSPKVGDLKIAQPIYFCRGMDHQKA